MNDIILMKIIIFGFVNQEELVSRKKKTKEKMFDDVARGDKELKTCRQIDFFVRHGMQRNKIRDEDFRVKQNKNKTLFAKTLTNTKHL